MADGALYKPLSTPTSFRLLELLPGKSGDAVSCHISEQNLNDEPYFTALSYEWGLVPGEEIVYVNSHPLAVRKNLVDFLRVLRGEITHSIIIWADAICINQSNIKERGHQVQLMRRIFRGAADVKSWLGPLRPELTSAVDFCNLRPWTQSGWHRDSMSLDWEEALVSVASDTEIRRSETCTRPERLQALAETVLPRVTELCRIRYWTRLWIMPEIILGRNVQLNWHDKSISLADFCEAMNWVSGQIEPDGGLAARKKTLFDQRMGDAAEVIDAFDFHRIRGWRRAIQSGFNMTLRELFTVMGNRNCLHARDRIYALLGVCCYQSEDLPIRVDYEADSSQVFIDTIQYCTRSDQLDLSIYGVLMSCLTLQPGPCLSRLLTAWERQEIGVSPRHPLCPSHRNEGLRTLKINVIQPQEEAVQFHYRLPGGRVLVASQALETGDSWTALGYITEGRFVAAIMHREGDSDSEEDSASQEDADSAPDTRRRSVNLKAIGVNVAAEFADCSLLKLQSSWSNYQPDGVMTWEEDIARRRWMPRVTLSLLDLAVLNTFPTEDQMRRERSGRACGSKEPQE